MYPKLYLWDFFINYYQITKMSEEQNQPKAENQESVEVFDFDKELEQILTDHYELMYIVPVSFTSEELKPITEKIKKLIEDHKGQITKQDDLGKQKFAYPIKHQSHGYYQLVEFDMPKDNLVGLNSALQLTTEILRFLVVKAKIKTEEDLKKEKELQEKLAKKKEKEIEKIKADEKEAKDKPKAAKEKKKVSLEDLDKKLDELLDTEEIL